MDSEMDGMATGLSTCILKDGTQTLTADIPWSGRKITGYGSTSAANARTDVPAWGQVQDGAATYAVAGGSADALTLTLSPAITAYAAGQIFWTRLTADNATTTPTLAVSGLAQKTIKKRGATTGAALAAGDLKTGNIAGFAYQSATDTFELITPSRVGGLDSANTWAAAQTFSAGIIFANETLSTYDEGSFTPAMAFGGGTTGITYSNQVGRYTRIGNLVFFTLYVELSAKGSSSGAATVTGLPFTSANITNLVVPLRAQANLVDLNVAGGYYAVSPSVVVNSTSINLFEQGDNNAAAALTDADFSNTSELRISGHYQV